MTTISTSLRISSGQPVDVPVCWSFHARVIFYFPLYLCKDSELYRYVINTCDDTPYNLSAYV